MSAARNLKIRSFYDDTVLYWRLSPEGYMESAFTLLDLPAFDTTNNSAEIE